MNLKLMSMLFKQEAALATTAVESILEKFRSSKYQLDIEPEFVEQFLEDRRCIFEATRTVIERDQKLCAELLNANMYRKFQVGMHLFGQSSVEEHYALDLLIRTLKPSRILEVGVFRGHTALTMCRALSQTNAAGTFTGVDIEKTAIEIARGVIDSFGLSPMAQFIEADSAAVLSTLPAPDFVFIDGDHSFEAVACDFVTVYNKVATGTVIAVHDIGSKAWGFHHNPGWLFYKVLPELLKGKIVQSWLDSMCTELTMQMISPGADGGQRFCGSDAEAVDLARTITTGMVNGWGGLGFVMKLDGQDTLVLEDVLSRAPRVPPIAPVALVPPRRFKRLRRVLRRMVRWLE